LVYVEAVVGHDQIVGNGGDVHDADGSGPLVSS
jgi:hypothetical protein